MALGACFLLLAGGASAFLVTLDVVVVTDRTSYQIGDVVNATVYVLDQGVLTDADSVSLYVAFYGGWTPLENVSLVHVGTGTYQGAFRMTANLTSTGPFGLTLRAAATVGAVSDTAMAYIFFQLNAGLQVRLILSAYTVSPGGSVSGILTVTENGQPRDADAINVSATIFSPPASSTTYPQANLSNPGTYGFVYNVPASLNASTTISITGTATVVEGNATFTQSDHAFLVAHVFEWFVVWYAASNWSAHPSYLDIWVADTSGSPVADATVTLYAYTGPIFSMFPPPGQQATTSAQGRARFPVSLAGTDFLGFSGYVTKADRTQSFAGEVPAPANVSSPFPGLTLRRNDVLDVFEPGEIAVLNYTALFNYVPLNGTQLYYDVHNATALLAYGSLIIPRWSAFTLSFRMPRDAATIDVGGLMPNGGWSAASDTATPAMRLTVDAGSLRGEPFQVGEGTTLFPELPASGGPWTVSVTFYLYDASSYPDLRPVWAAAEDFAGMASGVGEAPVGGSNFELTLMLPTYLPGNQDYYLEIVASPSTATPALGAPLLPYVAKELVYVSGPPALPSSPVFVLSLFLVLAAIGVASVILVGLVSRRLLTGPPRHPRS